MESNNIKLAIIIPITKKIWIVEKAIKSVQQQTAKNHIVLYLINDCSKYNYQSLIQKYSKDINIIYLKTKENLGPGLTRQFVIDQCVEKYMLFCDDDDWLYDEYVIENYLNAIKKYEKECFNKIAVLKASYYEIIDDFKERVYPNESFLLMGCVYNKDFLKTYNIRMNPRLQWMFEDYYFTHEVLYKSRMYGYKIIELPNIISYVRYHTKDFDSLTCSSKEINGVLLQGANIYKNFLYSVIFFGEEIRLHEEIPNISPEEKKRVLQILQHFYINAETILSLFEEHGLSEFSQHEKIVFYENIHYLMDKVEKNFELIIDTAPYYKDIGENYQYINYLHFKETVEERLKKLL